MRVTKPKPNQTEPKPKPPKNKDVASLCNSHRKQWKQTRLANSGQAVMRLTLTVRICWKAVINFSHQCPRYLWDTRVEGVGELTLHTSGPPLQDLPHTSSFLLEWQFSNHRHISEWENSQIWVQCKKKKRRHIKTLLKKSDFSVHFPIKTSEVTPSPRSAPKRDVMRRWIAPNMNCPHPTWQALCWALPRNDRI